MKKTYWHATPKETFLAHVIREGIKSPTGVIYLCADPHDCLRFMELYHPLGGDFAVIPIKLDETEVKVSTDSNPEYLPEAYFVERDILPEELPNKLDDVLLFELRLKK